MSRTQVQDRKKKDTHVDREVHRRVTNGVPDLLDDAVGAYRGNRK